MSIEQIEKAIEQLPREDLLELKNWFQRKLEDDWDMQIVEDVQSGRLDAIAQEALMEYHKGKTESFPGDEK